jgi:hypothetical protein
MSIVCNFGVISSGRECSLRIGGNRIFVRTVLEQKSGYGILPNVGDTEADSFLTFVPVL